MGSKLAARAQVQLPAWHYISGQTLWAPDSQPLTIPSTATIIQIGAETNVCYWNAGPLASPGSPGYIPAASVAVLGPLDDTTLATGISVDCAGTVHVTYWREV